MDRIRSSRKTSVTDQEKRLIHAYADSVLPTTGWRSVRPLLMALRKELLPDLLFDQLLKALEASGWYLRITPRGPHSGMHALVSRVPTEWTRQPRRMGQSYPRVHTALQRFLDDTVAPGSEVEVGQIYSRFLVAHLMDPIPYQVLSKQLDRSRYSVLSTTRDGRRVRMLRRAC